MENIDIDKEISENIDIDKISNQLEFGISKRARSNPCQDIFGGFDIVYRGQPKVTHKNWSDLVWSYLISLNSLLFKNIAHVGSFKNFVFVFVFVFVCVCVFVNCNAISTLDYIYLLQHRMIELILYYIQEDLLLKVLVFVFVFVFVCVFVFVSVITR